MALATLNRQHKDAKVGASADQQDMSMKTLTFAKRPELSRYELRVDGELAALADYVDNADKVRMVHTEVLPGFAGQGLPTQLMAQALADVRQQGKQVVAECSFVAAYLHKHPVV